MTREEILAICEGHLRRLDRAIAHWTSEGKRSGELSDEEMAATLSRRDALASLIARDAFMELQKGVPDEIAFLKSDLLRRERAAIEKATAARKRERQGRENASTLLKALEARGVTVPSGLREKLQSVASGRVTNAESVLAQGFNLLIPSGPTGLSAAQRELIGRLKESNAEQSFEAWKAKQRVPSPIDLLLDRVDGQIAEAQTVLGNERTAGYVQRLRSIEYETNAARQSLLLDSLMLDLSSDIETVRSQGAGRTQLAELSLDLLGVDSAAAAALQEAIAACDTTTRADRLAALAEECRALVSAETQRKAAQSRRDVILHGLAKLGYEVHEGMTTAWAKDGRVVLRKPSLPGYGVEVGGQAETSRLQVRAVALSENRDVSRDKDVETIWCGEFSRLQQLVAEDGNNLLIERALGVGEVPLKVVGDEAQSSGSIVAKRTMN
ncbi:hypothetical protein LJR034_005280 [Caballeronia sp. LjRoot34]|uniref:hypothetical protein n=1 Tax=Caballeronia sp. LjRoot34 TaxID=3342325 RepID=UPI003ECFFA65